MQENIKPRTEKPDDEEITTKATEMLIELMSKHDEIEGALWMGAMFTCIASGYINTGVSYKNFCQELEDVKQFYKEKWAIKIH